MKDRLPLDTGLHVYLAEGRTCVQGEQQRR